MGDGGDKNSLVFFAHKLHLSVMDKIHALNSSRNLLKSVIHFLILLIFILGFRNNKCYLPLVVMFIFSKICGSSFIFRFVLQVWYGAKFFLNH